MFSTQDWFFGLLAFLLIGGGLVSLLQAESQTRAKADALGKQNDEAWQLERTTRVRRNSSIALVLGLLVLLQPLLS